MRTTKLGTSKKPIRSGTLKRTQKTTVIYRVPNTIKSITLTNIRKSDKHALMEITSKAHIMKFIGSGKTWTSDDVDKYINYTIQDARIPAHKRTWFSYAIRDLNNLNLIGVIEFKCISIYHIIPFNLRQKYKNDVALTIYINDKYQGKGVAKMAIEQLKNKIRKLKPQARKLISLVKSSNQVMQQVMIKLGFTYIEQINSQNTNLLLYNANIK
jgi:RimJ/RimL family protein N-acetyltransferase